MRISRGFTLIELVVVLVIVASVAAMVLPHINDDRVLRLVAASTVVESDLDFVQVMNIAYPETPAVMRFDTANNTYWVAYADDPDLPIIRPDTGEPYVVTMGVGRAEGAAGVDLFIFGATSDTIAYNAQGGLIEINDAPRITLTLGGLSVDIDVAAMTGSITETDIYTAALDRPGEEEAVVAFGNGNAAPQGVANMSQPNVPPNGASKSAHALQ